jgi:hypothetical protein
MSHNREESNKDIWKFTSMQKGRRFLDQHGSKSGINGWTFTLIGLGTCSISNLCPLCLVWIEPRDRPATLSFFLRRFGAAAPGKQQKLVYNLVSAIGSIMESCCCCCNDCQWCQQQQQLASWSPPAGNRDLTSAAAAPFLISIQHHALVGVLWCEVCRTTIMRA